MSQHLNLGGISPMGQRARLRWRSRLRSMTANPVYKISGSGLGGARPAPDFFQSGASSSGGLVSPSGGGGGGGGIIGSGFGFRHHGGWPYYYGGYYWPYWSYPAYWYYPSLYPAYGYTYPSYQAAYTYPSYTQTVPSACCYDAESGSLYCPGSQYDGAPAYAEATRVYQGRPMSYVSSPRLSQEQWFWDCPAENEPPPRRVTRLRARAA